MKQIIHKAAGLGLPLLFLTALALLFNACEKKGSYGPAGGSYGGVTGHVYVSGSLKPIANVVVSCGGAVDTTGKSGRYSLGDIPVGTQDISASNLYYQGYTSKIVVRGNEVTIFDIFLTYSTK